MSRKQKKYQPRLCAILAAFSLTACGLSGGPESGKVIDATTNEPVEGVIVVARWIGHLATWAHGSTNCYHVESTTTDENGEFHIPKWKKEYTEDWQKNVSPRDVDITVYKSGYQHPPRHIEEQADLKGIYYMEPSTGSVGERLRKIAGAAVTCGAAGESKRNLLHLYRSLYENANALVTTKEDKKIMSDLLYLVEKIELPYEEASKRNTDRLNAIDHE